MTKYGYALSGYLEKFKDIRDSQIELTVTDVYVKTKKFKDLNKTLTKFFRSKELSKKEMENYEIQKIFERALDLKKEIESEINKLKKLKVVDKTSKSRDLVYVGKSSLDIGWSIKSFVNQYSDKLKGIKGLKRIYKNISKQNIQTWGDMDKSQLLHVIQCMIILVADHGKNTTRKYMAMFELHHESQVSPNYLEGILNELGLDYVGRDIMRMSTKHFLKSNNLPDWIMNYEMRSEDKLT